MKFKCTTQTRVRVDNILITSMNTFNIYNELNCVQQQMEMIDVLNTTQAERLDNAYKHRCCSQFSKYLNLNGPIQINFDIL